MSSQSQGKGNLASGLFKHISRLLKFFTAKVPGDRVLSFPAAQAFGRYDQFFPSDAIAHPAKANSAMIEWIILRYTKEGDVIVDPMAGTFSTCVIAAINNRHGIGVELEDKFYAWGLEAKQRVKQIPTLTGKGRMFVLKGDARELSKVLAKISLVDADAIVFSPPYSESLNKRQAVGGIAERDPNFWKKMGCYSGNEKNIGNLPHGNADAIVTSPPYEESLSPKRHHVITGNGIPKRDPKLAASGQYEVKDEKKNIGCFKANTYLGAMLQVYRECYKVLKPGGVMVLITKNFIRNKKIVRLDIDTIKLCEVAGFIFVERWYLKLEKPSFWRIIYAKKFHYCPRCVRVYRVRKSTSDKPSRTRCPKCGAKLLPALIPFEDILVFRKRGAEE